MSKEELIEKLKLVALLKGDKEAAHLEADKAVLDYIGDEEITKLFEAIEKWYA